MHKCLVDFISKGFLSHMFISVCQSIGNLARIPFYLFWFSIFLVQARGFRWSVTAS